MQTDGKQACATKENFALTTNLCVIHNSFRNIQVAGTYKNLEHVLHEFINYTQILSNFCVAVLQNELSCGLW